MTGAAKLAVDTKRAALLVVDIQDKLAAAMPAEAMAAMERNVAILIEAARRFEMPVVVSQQYPRGLGQTLETVDTALAGLGELVHRFDKLEFSACDADAFDPIAKKLGRDQWIVTGMECHVCVYQTARGLRAHSATVFVPQDAVISRAPANWRVGLDLMARAGCVVTSTEVVVFDALGKAGSDDFKALSRLIR
jgi:nicotinamidase-related amidase